MPDIFINSLNLIIEIKGTNNHYQKRDLELQNLKEDAVVQNKEFAYIIVYDKKYDDLVNLIENLKNSD